MSDQWATYADAATLTGVNEALLRKWKRKGVVASTTISGRVHVALGDVRRAERSLRLHGTRPGQGRRRADLRDVTRPTS